MEAANAKIISAAATDPPQSPQVRRGGGQPVLRRSEGRLAGQGLGQAGQLNRPAQQQTRFAYRRRRLLSRVGGSTCR